MWALALGIPYALLLGLLVALLDLIPVVGSTIGGIIVSLVALTVSVEVAIATAIFYFVYRFLEDYLLTPRIMARTVAVPGLVTVIATVSAGRCSASLARCGDPDRRGGATSDRAGGGAESREVLRYLHLLCGRLLRQSVLVTPNPGSAGHDRRGQRDPMILGPGWSQPFPRSVENIVAGARTQPAEGLIDHGLGVIQVDVPATCVSEFGELLAIHDGVGPGLIGHPTLDSDVVGEVERPGPKRDRQDRRGERGRELVDAADAR